MSKKTKNNLIIFCIIILAVAAIGCVSYKISQKYRTDCCSVVDPAVVEEDQASTEEPKTPEEVENSSDPDSGKTDQTPTQYEGESANKSESITGQITYAAKNGTKLAIRVSIDQFLKTPGTCELKLLQKGKVKYETSVPTLDDASSATCQGFDLDASKLKGNYDIQIKVTAGKKSGTITGKVAV